MFRVSLWSPVLRNVIRSSASHIRTTSRVAALSKFSIFFQVGPKRFNTCRFFSTENSTERSHLGSASFPKIARSPNFVDKTLFIEAFLECGSDYLLITAPRRFGKSINLDMLRCFFHDKTYETLFSKLRIGNTTTMEKLGTLPTVWLNFRVAGRITSYEEAVIVCRKIIHNAYLEHRYLATSPKIDNDDLKNYCNIWCDPIRYKSLDETDVSEGLERLVECLSMHCNGRKTLLLVDEYDAICTAAFANVDVKTLDQIIELYGGIVGSVVKQNAAKFVERAVITGILRVMCAGLSSPVNNIVEHPFSEDERFADFYGITEAEFNELMSRKCNSSARHLKNEALRYYNGYTWDNNRILNPWSVMNFLDKKIVKPYWVESGIPNLRINSVCKKDLVRTTVKKLVEGDTMNVDARILDARNLHSFVEDFRSTDKIIRIDPLLYYYSQQGYLTIVQRLYDSARLRIPNAEVKNMFISSLALYFQETYCIDRVNIDTCANLLENINLSDENECKNTIEHIGRELQAMCNRGDYSRSELMNEALLEDLMFVLMYLSGFQPVTQTTVRQTDGSFTKLDLCVYRNTSRSAVIEFKVNETAKVALDTIFEKGYARELFHEWKLSYLRQLVSFFTGKKSECSRDLTEDILREYLPEKYNFLLIGINLEKNKGKCRKHVLSIRYLRNSFREEDEIQIVLN